MQNLLLLDLSLDNPPAMDHPLPEIGDWDELASWPSSPLLRLSAESMLDVMECREPVCAANDGESGRSVAQKGGELANKTDIWSLAVAVSGEPMIALSFSEVPYKAQSELAFLAPCHHCSKTQLHPLRAVHLCGHVCCI